MRLAIFILALMSWLSGPALKRAHAQDLSISESPSASARTAGGAASGAQNVDGIAARIEDDVITESEVRELGAFQKLVDGSAKPRIELIKELADQWIVRGEAAVAAFPSAFAGRY